MTLITKLVISQKCLNSQRQFYLKQYGIETIGTSIAPSFHTIKKGDQYRIVLMIKSPKVIFGFH